MRLTGSIYLTSRFFVIGGAGAALFFISYGIELLLIPANFCVALLLAFTVYDCLNLYNKKSVITGTREVNPVWSLGSETEVIYHLKNHSSVNFNVTLMDELPEQFQERNHRLHLTLAKGENVSKKTRLRAVTRGSYCFGKTWVFISTVLNLAERRLAISGDTIVKVYPSIEQMKQLQLANFNRAATSIGVKKVRRLGNTQEFEQIKNFAIGDDQKRINWKATGKRAEIMVNQYQEEKSQQIYCVIDKSRSMDFVSDGLTLLDYSINAALVLSNIATQKQDKAGLITYSSKPETFVKAERKTGQLKVILENLYREKESQAESNLELVYYAIRKNITQRSLLIFFTNFESAFALERALPIFRKLNKSHVVMVLFFENEEISEFSLKEANEPEGVYDQILAEKFLFEKRQIQKRLRNYGIYSVVTKPDQLALNAINKYLELKSRGVI